MITYEAVYVDNFQVLNLKTKKKKIFYSIVVFIRGNTSYFSLDK